jgi:hypothetical protein
MNNEEFYAELDSYITEYTIEYVEQIKSIAREILSRDEDSDINLEELEDYLQMQEHLFMEKLEIAIKEVKEEIESDESGYEPLKTKILSRIKNTFREIFQKIVSKLKDIVG